MEGIYGKVRASLQNDDLSPGNIPGTCEQMTYIILMDDNYLRVYDLTTGQIASLDKFPNKKHILRLLF